MYQRAISLQQRIYGLFGLFKKTLGSSVSNGQASFLQNTKLRHLRHWKALKSLSLELPVLISETKFLVFFF